MEFVDGDWMERQQIIRRNYARYKRGVDAGILSWQFPCNPYLVADWKRLMTPIELAMWDEMRSEGVAFWPQFPVGKYMVDFAQPDRKIAIECDGSAYHDVDKDSVRDRELRLMGWTTYRIPGRECFADEIVLRTLWGEELSLGSFRA
nr:DUF559 domain-containing protein [Burkholderia sp. GbtcB21]